MTSLKISICALTAVMGLSAFTNAPASTIGGTNADWNSRSKAAGWPEARQGLV